MLKKNLYIVLLIVFGSCSNDAPEISLKESTLISSPSFEQALIDIGIDTDGILNGTVLTDDISKITYLPLFDHDISDLSGIENFNGLKKLDCYNNQLTSLDVSQNTVLKELDFHNNQLTSIDVGQNTALTSLVCFDNHLTSLDVSQNIVLSTLACTNNQLTSLDVSLNTILSQLYCSENQLSSIDVSQNTDLVELFCFDNQLTTLDVSQNTALIELYCYGNQLTSLNVKNGNNSILTKFNSEANNDLHCIEVDNETDANADQAPYNVWFKEAMVTYSEDCSSL